MSETTTTPADDPLAGLLPLGEFHSSIHDGALRIDQADPRILISAELIDSAAFGILRPEVTLTLDHAADAHLGALLKIRAADRQVVYRLTKWIPSVRCYLGEWPE